MLHKLFFFPLIKSAVGDIYKIIFMMIVIMITTVKKSSSSGLYCSYPHFLSKQPAPPSPTPVTAAGALRCGVETTTSNEKLPIPGHTP